MSPHVENNRAECLCNEDSPDSPNLSTSSSKASSPIPGSPDQILQSRLLPTTSHDRGHDSHHSLDRGFFKEILNNRPACFGRQSGQFLERFPHRNDRAGSGCRCHVGRLHSGQVRSEKCHQDWLLIFHRRINCPNLCTGFDMLLVGRFVGGIGIGILSMACPMYMGEISPNNIRGALLCLEEFNIVLGIVVAFWITYMTRLIESEVSWRLPFGIQLLPAIIILLGLSLLPSSPSWLASHQRYDECLKTLSTLRQLPIDDESVRQEWFDIRVEAEFQRELHLARFGELPEQAWSQLKMEFQKWGDTFSKRCRRRTLVGVGLSFFQQFVGINALIYYSPTLFETLGLDVELRLQMSGIMNMCQLFGVTISFLFIDKVGRRPLLLFGSVMMTICHLTVAILIRQYSADWAQHKIAGWAGVAFLLLYMVVFGVSWGPIPWAMPSEIFPSSLRAKGVAVSTMSNWINNFIIGFITPPLIEKTNEGAFIFFAFNSLLSWVFVWLVVPETAYRSLEEMDRVFGDQLAVEDQLKKSQIFQKIISQEH